MIKRKKILFSTTRYVFADIAFCLSRYFTNLSQRKTAKQKKHYLSGKIINCRTHKTLLQLLREDYQRMMKKSGKGIAETKYFETKYYHFFGCFLLYIEEFVKTASAFQHRVTVFVLFFYFFLESGRLLKHFMISLRQLAARESFTD